MSLHTWTIAAWLAVAAVSAIPAAGAVEAPPGSKNFNSPNFVPNYFSNERGPFVGNAAPRTPQTTAAPVGAAPAPRVHFATASNRQVMRHAAAATKSRDRVAAAKSKTTGKRSADRANASRSGKSGKTATALAKTARVGRTGSRAPAVKLASAKATPVAAKGKQANR